MLRQVQTIVGVCMGALVLGAIVVASVEPGEPVGCLTGIAISLALMAVHAWPGEGPIGKTMTGLERDGARLYLREQLGLGSVGPIQEL